MKKPKTLPLDMEFVRHLILPGGTEERLDYDTTIPTDVTEAERIIAEAKRAFTERTSATFPSTEEHDEPTDHWPPRATGTPSAFNSPMMRRCDAAARRYSNRRKSVRRNDRRCADHGYASRVTAFSPVNADSN